MLHWGHLKTYLNGTFEGDNLAELAPHVLSLSDHFNSGQGPTPWASRPASLAYLVYFHPLNFLRASRAGQEVLHSQPAFFESIELVVDFGSGSGAALFAVAELARRAGVASKIRWMAYDRSSEALTHLSSLARLAGIEVVTSTEASVVSRALQSCSKALLIASYSLNELTDTTAFLDQWPASSYLLIEPATRPHFLRLAQLRLQLLERSQTLLAPCPHSAECPLAKDGKDWCHSRVKSLSLPVWWEDLERRLPMKNQSITMSFLATQKTALAQSAATTSWSRLVGDTRLDKGQSRQLICQGPEKLWIRWFPNRIRGLPKDFQLPRDLRIKTQLLPEPSGQNFEIADPQLFVDPTQPACSSSARE